MMKMALSPGAFGLLRALAMKAEVPRDRILLSAWRSVDWQSLTFVGERHHISLRICGPDSAQAVSRLPAAFRMPSSTSPVRSSPILRSSPGRTGQATVQRH